jgi:hypothetical protein
MREKTGTGLQVWFKFPVGGSVPVIFSSMVLSDLKQLSMRPKIFDEAC